MGTSRTGADAGNVGGSVVDVGGSVVDVGAATGAGGAVVVVSGRATLVGGAALAGATLVGGAVTTAILPGELHADAAHRQATSATARIRTGALRMGFMSSSSETSIATAGRLVGVPAPAP